MIAKAFNSQNYRYGFNGMEMDDEIKGSGNSYDFGARIYDPRLGRWLAVDPLAVKYPELSPYSFVANSPLILIDPNGKEIYVAGIKYIPVAQRTEEDIKRIAESNSDVQKVYQALDYIHKNATSENGANKVTDMINSEVKIKISITSAIGSDQATIGKPMGYLEALEDVKSTDIDVNINPNVGMEIGKGKMSPTVKIAHELDHAWEGTMILEALTEVYKKGGEVSDELNERMVNWDFPDHEEQRAVGDGSLEGLIGKSLNQTYRTNYKADNKTFKRFYYSSNVLDTSEQQNVSEEDQQRIDVKSEETRKSQGN